jgi:hypothetical protein
MHQLLYTPSVEEQVEESLNFPMKIPESAILLFMAVVELERDSNVESLGRDSKASM